MGTINLHAGNRYEFAGLLGEVRSNDTRIMEVTGISVTGNVQFRLEMFAPATTASARSHSVQHHCLKFSG